MVEPGSYWLLLILVVLVGGSAFFSASETALTSLSKIRLRNMMEDKVRNADKISRLVEHPGKLLSTILVGNNLVNICASSLATYVAMSINPTAGVGIATIVMTIVILIFGEITPKTVAAQNSEKISLKVAGLIGLLEFLFTPVIVVLNVVTSLIMRLFGVDLDKKNPIITEEELKTMVTVGHEEGVLEPDEKNMINNVFDFGDSKAKDIMTPRTDIVAVDILAGYDEVINIFKEEHFSKLPVYKDTIDNIIGVISLKDIMFIDKEEFQIERYMREPFYSDETKGVSELFSQMKAQRLSVAIILDEYGGTAGMVTMEDIIEEIMGEIVDEYDEFSEEIQQVAEKEYLIDGLARIDDVNEALGTNFESEDMDTIGGFVIGYLGRFPNTGEKLNIDEHKVIIEKADRNRVSMLRIFL